MNLTVPQKRLGPRAFFASVVAVYLIQILAIDMYAPALPTMQVELGVTPAELNSTMFAFLLASTIAMFFSGPISDRFGRKRTFLAGCILFTVGSVGSCVSDTVGLLVVFRVIEALGMGTSATISNALVKDSFEGEDLKLTMTLLQSLIIIGSIAAPFMGSFAVEVVGWRGVFALLSVGGGVTVLLSALISETYRAPEDASLAQTVGDMLCIAKSLVKEKGFTALACFIGVAGIPFFAFIAVASYIFIDYFEMSYLDYSLIYAATCVVNLVAPYVYLKMQKRFDTPTIMRICIVLTGVSFAVMAFVGDASPWGICVGFLPYALAEGIARPAAYLVLLEQPEENVGTASAFGNFAYGGITSFATVLATLNWPTFVFALVVLMGASAAGMLALYAAGHGGWTEAARR